MYEDEGVSLSGGAGEAMAEHLHLPGAHVTNIMFPKALRPSMHSCNRLG